MTVPGGLRSTMRGEEGRDAATSRLRTSVGDGGCRRENRSAPRDAPRRPCRTGRRRRRVGDRGRARRHRRRSAATLERLGVPVTAACAGVVLRRGRLLRRGLGSLALGLGAGGGLGVAVAKRLDVFGGVPARVTFPEVSGAQTHVKAAAIPLGPAPRGGGGVPGGG